MKRIGIDVEDRDHTKIKVRAAREGQSIANYVRLLLGLPLGKQGERTDLNGKRKEIKETS